MSRRLREYAHCKRETVDETMFAITHRHRHSKAIGRRKIGELQQDTSIITQHIPSSLPIGEVKAIRIAQALHARKN